jgi:hypothetical protein
MQYELQFCYKKADSEIYGVNEFSDWYGKPRSCHFSYVLKKSVSDGLSKFQIYEM